VALAGASATRAAHDLETSSLGEANIEIVVLESDGCIYCQIFRRDVLPAYQASRRARDVPLRFVDLNRPEAGNLALAEPISIVPTAVLLRNNREVGRIDGYVGPEAFFHSVNRLMSGLQ
jgi:thioredoxin-related protein